MAHTHEHTFYSLSKFEKQLNAMRAIKYTKGGNSAKGEYWVGGLKTGKNRRKRAVITGGKVEKGGAAAAQVAHTRSHTLRQRVGVVIYR